MKNKKVAEMLDQIADLLEFHGQVVFKINAYRKASRVISEMTEDLEQVWKQGRLAEIPGVGKGLQAHIDEFFKTGDIRQRQELLDQSPRELFDLLAVQNFGPKTAALAFRELGVQSLADLQQVIDDGRLAELPGMGEKRVANIRKGLQTLQTAGERVSIGVATPLCQTVMDYLREQSEAQLGRLSPAGSLRRGKESVHDIDLVAETENGANLIQRFVSMPGVTRILGAGDTKGSILFNDRIQIDLRAVPPSSYGAALQYFTGSKEHNVRLREIARAAGYKINEYGIFQAEKNVGGRREEEIYEALGMSWIPPELREDRGEIESALQGKLPELITFEDMKAELHVHSAYSDGQLTLEEMARHVADMGYDYMSFCDHSQSARYANGMEIPRLKEQMDAIRRLNKKMAPFTVLCGVEVDIRADGSLDYSDEVLAELDFVVASIHSAFKTDPTERTIQAMRNPYVDVIGHPTGRLISRREGFAIDLNRILQVGAETGTALEINSYWDRLDLGDINARAAVQAGVKLSINTDAHSPEHLAMVHFGIATARRGWVRKEDVINCLPLSRFKKWQKRSRL
ncbi:MAG TPA: DNA polymerase/3'-5' exonuclease PolX [bacterium]|nr:DNA polymerase/3'-5' exonuclease PolX [bacterium]